MVHLEGVGEAWVPAGGEGGWLAALVLSIVYRQRHPRHRGGRTIGGV